MTFPQTSVKHNPVKPLPDAPCDADVVVVDSLEARRCEQARLRPPQTRGQEQAGRPGQAGPGSAYHPPNGGSMVSDPGGAAAPRKNFEPPHGEGAATWT